MTITGTAPLPSIDLAKRVSGLVASGLSLNRVAVIVMVPKGMLRLWTHNPETPDELAFSAIVNEGLDTVQHGNEELLKMSRQRVVDVISDPNHPDALQAAFKVLNAIDKDFTPKAELTGANGSPLIPPNINRDDMLRELAELAARNNEGNK